MNLQERLQALIGHDFVFINVFGDPTDEEGIPYSSVPRGRLREVGDGYFIIETKSVEDGGFVQELGGEWLVSIKYVTSVFHTIADCAGCAVDTVSGKLKAEGG